MKKFSLPISGEVINLEEMGDPVFASKSVGDGIAIIPNDNKIYAPSDGVVESLYPTKHAIGIRTKTNHEILIHIGLNTVNLKGEGFNVHVSQGDRIKKGQLLIDFDLESLKEKGYDLTTAVIFTQKDDIVQLDIEGSVKANEQLLSLNK